MQNTKINLSSPAPKHYEVLLDTSNFSDFEQIEYGHPCEVYHEPKNWFKNFTRRAQKRMISRAIRKAAKRCESPVWRKECGTAECGKCGKCFESFQIQMLPVFSLAELDAVGVARRYARAFPTYRCEPIFHMGECGICSDDYCTCDENGVCLDCLAPQEVPANEQEWAMKYYPGWNVEFAKYLHKMCYNEPPIFRDWEYDDAVQSTFPEEIQKYQDRHLPKYDIWNENDLNLRLLYSPIDLAQLARTMAEIVTLQASVPFSINDVCEVLLNAMTTVITNIQEWAMSPIKLITGVITGMVSDIGKKLAQVLKDERKSIMRNILYVALTIAIMVIGTIVDCAAYTRQLAYLLLSIVFSCDQEVKWIMLVAEFIFEINVAKQVQGPMDIIPKLIFLLASVGLTWVMPASTDFMTLLRKFDMIPKAVSGLDKMSEMFNDCYQKAGNVLYEYTYGHARPAAQKIPDEVEEHHKKVYSFSYEEMSQVSVDPVICNRVANLFVEYQQLRKKYHDDREVMNFLNGYNALMNNYYNRASTSNPKPMAQRVLPVSAFFYGGSGVGKSTILNYLLAGILKQKGVLHGGMTDAECEEVINACAYPRASEQEYWDRYMKQLVCIYDDAFQRKDSESLPNEEFFELIRAVNTFSYPLHMADLAQKSNTYFTSEFLLATTNLQVIRPKSMEETTAVLNRIHLPYAVRVKAEYRRKPETEFKWVMGQNGDYSLDPSKVVDAAGNPVYSMDVYEVFRWDPSTGQVHDEEEPLSFDDVAKQIWRRHLQHKRAKESMTTGILKHIRNVNLEYRSIPTLAEAQLDPCLHGVLRRVYDRIDWTSLPRMGWQQVAQYFDQQAYETRLEKKAWMDLAYVMTTFQEEGEREPVAIYAAFTSFMNYMSTQLGFDTQAQDAHGNGHPPPSLANPDRAPGRYSQFLSQLNWQAEKAEEEDMQTPADCFRKVKAIYDELGEQMLFDLGEEPEQMDAQVMLQAVQEHYETTLDAVFNIVSTRDSYEADGTIWTREEVQELHELYEGESGSESSEETAEQQLETTLDIITPATINLMTTIQAAECARYLRLGLASCQAMGYEISGELRARALMILVYLDERATIEPQARMNWKEISDHVYTIDDGEEKYPSQWRIELEEWQPLGCEAKHQKLMDHIDRSPVEPPFVRMLLHDYMNLYAPETWTQWIKGYKVWTLDAGKKQFLRMKMECQERTQKAVTTIKKVNEYSGEWLETFTKTGLILGTIAMTAYGLYRGYKFMTRKNESDKIKAYPVPEGSEPDVRIFEGANLNPAFMWNGEDEWYVIFPDGTTFGEGEEIWHTTEGDKGVFCMTLSFAKQVLSFCDERHWTQVEKELKSPTLRVKAEESGTSKDMHIKRRLESGTNKTIKVNRKLENENTTWKKMQEKNKQIQAMVSHQAAEISQRVKLQYGFLRKDTTLIYCPILMICGNVGLLNKHYWTLMPETFEFVLSAGNAPMPLRKSDCKIDVIDRAGTGKSDIYAVTLPRVVPGVRDITSSFVDAEELYKLPKKRFFLLAPGLNNRDMNTKDVFFSYKSGTVDSISFATTPTAAGSDRVLEIKSTDCKSENGDCGGVWIMDEDNVRGKIFGVHYAGGKGTAYAIVCTRQDVEKFATKKLQAAPQQEYEMAFDGVIPQYHDVPAPMPMVTSFEPTAIKGKVDDCGTEPVPLGNILAPGGPGLLGLAKVTHTPKLPDQHLLEKSVNSFGEKLFNGQPAEEYEKRVLTIEEACAGIEGAPYVQGVNRSRSAGYPWVLRKGGNRGKRQWMDNGDGTWKFDGEFEEVRQAVQRKIDNCAKGIHEPAVYVDALKDETRPKGKKTRVFSMAPMDFVVTMRMYFLGFFSYIMRNKIGNEIAVGIKAQTVEWHELARHLQRKGEDVVAGDFTDYDGNLNPYFVWKVLDYANEWYNDGNDLIRETLWKDVAQSFHIAGDNVYQWTHSQPSGNPATTIINSICNSLMCRYVYYRAMERAGLEREFNDDVSMISYGDDNVLNIREEVVPYFNQLVMSEIFPEIGMTYTDADKKAIVEPTSTLTKVSFLKRGFRWADSLWVGPLERKSINNRMEWQKKGSDTETLVENAKMAIAEWALHSEEEYEFWSKKIQTVFMEELNIRLPQHQQGYYIGLVKTGGYEKDFPYISYL